MSSPWRRWWRMCFKEKTDSCILMESPILERLTPFRVRRFGLLDTLIRVYIWICFDSFIHLWSIGSGQEAGLLPRALVSLFRKLQGRLYAAMDVKPVMYQDVRQLNAGEVRAEEIRRNSLLKEVTKITFSKRQIIFFCPRVCCHSIIFEWFYFFRITQYLLLSVTGW